MCRLLIAVLLLLFTLTAQAEASSISAGLGLEARMQKEVNPDYIEGKTLGQIFAQVLWENWGLHVELGKEDHVTNAGAMTISSKSYNSGVWGRYIFRNTHLWQPFLGAGVGAYFDTVTSRFGNALDERSGVRPYVGANAGVSAVFWKYLLVEAEGRMTGVRDRKEPMLSALLRIGFYY
jgi:hypothetical protein